MKNSIKNILIPLNFSSSSESAVATGIAMCKRHKAALHLLHVTEGNSLVLPPGKNPRTLELFLLAQTDLLKDLERRAAQIQEEHEISCFFHLATGSLYQAIATKTADFHCDLILVEKKRRPALFTFQRSQSVYRLLKMIGRPVLTVPAGSRNFNFKNVLFSLAPFSSESFSAGIALPIIRKNNSKVSLYASVRPAKKQSETELANQLTDLAQTLISGEKAAEIEKEIEAGPNTVKKIMSQAEDKKTDLIVVSARIADGLRSWFRNSGTRKILEESPYPVLAVL